MISARGVLAVYFGFLIGPLVWFGSGEIAFGSAAFVAVLALFIATERNGGER